MVIPDILQVEDDEDFSLLTQYASMYIDQSVTLNVVPSGKQALDLLHHLQEQGKKPRLILLDINLPGMSGVDVLIEIRQLKFFTSVPIVIFSTSDSPRDCKQAMEAGATSYQIKPMGYKNLVDCLRKLYAVYLPR